MAELLKRLWPKEQAEGLSEYALLLLLISLTAVTATGGLVSAISNCYSSASTAVQAATHGGSLAKDFLGYGVQVHTDAVPFYKDLNSRNTK